MFNIVSSIGNAAYKTATKTGIAAGVEQPPYPCALPLEEVPVDPMSDLPHVERLLDRTFEAACDLMGDMPLLHGAEDAAAEAKNKTAPRKKLCWKKVDYKDSEGDIELFTRPHFGAYNFARATFTLAGVHPRTVLSNMHSQDRDLRIRFSPNLVEYEVLARNPRVPAAYFATIHSQADALEEPDNDNGHLEEMARGGVRDWHIEYNQYYTPPPVAPREFMYLIEKRYVPAEDAYYVYGCSVTYKYDMSKFNYRFDKNIKGTNRACVRGAVLFAWKLTPDYARRTTRAVYVSSMNPNGWAPTFMVGWMKAQIAKEFTNSRRLLYLIVGAYRHYDFARAPAVAAKGAPNSGSNMVTDGSSGAREEEDEDDSDDSDDGRTIATMTAASSVYLVEHEELGEVLTAAEQQQALRRREVEGARCYDDSEEEELLPA